MAPLFDAALYSRNSGICILRQDPIRYHPFSLDLDLLVLFLDLFLLLYPCHSFYLIHLP
jgi:hypothetical protein